MAGSRAFLGLGSNAGDRAALLREAVRRLQAPDLRVTARSPIYETAPWGRTGQPTFLNQVIAVDTPLAPRALLERCLAVETALGRVRAERWGPRTVDVDVLLYDAAVVREPGLAVPHPELAHRAFVLKPLADVAPGLRLPDGADVEGLLAACPDRDLVWPWDDTDVRVVGRQIRWYDSLPSTNEMARDLAAGGAAEGTVVVAEEQTAGRGRMGRSWSSPRGGLWLSVILTPRLPAAHLPLVGLAACVGTAQAIEDAAGVAARVKWPNDVLVNGRKVAGTLLDSDGGAVVVGIGLNADVPPASLPSRPQYPATSLRAVLGHPVGRGLVLHALLRDVDRAYRELRDHGPAAILGRWRELADTLGRVVRAVTAGGTIDGLAYDIDSMGALLVRGPDGSTHRIVAGDVTGTTVTAESRDPGDLPRGRATPECPRGDGATAESRDPGDLPRGRAKPECPRGDGATEDTA